MENPINSFSIGVQEGTILQSINEEVDMSLITLKEYILNEHPISQQQFQQTVEGNQIDYNFLLDVINPDGAYQMRLLYASMFLVFFMSLQFNQMVYLFLPPQLSCEKKGDQNLLYTFQNYLSINNNQALQPQFNLQLEEVSVKTIYLPYQERLQQKVCTKLEDGSANGNVVFVDQMTMDNVTSEFKLYCKRRPIKTIIKLLMCLIASISGCLSAYLNRYNKRISIFAYLITFTLCILVYSGSFFKYQIPTQTIIKKHFTHGNHGKIPMIVQPYENLYHPLSLYNLISSEQFQQIIQDGQLLLFVGFYLGAIFGCSGLAFSLQPYLRDFYTESYFKSVKNNLFLSFTCAQLFGTLIKMIISDWRKYNFFMIGIPLLLLTFIILLLFKDSPQDQLLKLKRNLEPINQDDQENKSQINQKINILPENIFEKQIVMIILQDKLFLQMKLMCDINQRPFFNREQFTIVIDRLVKCMKDNNPFKFTFQTLRQSFALVYVTLIVFVLYITPYFLVSTLGQAITFNLFCIGLSEIFGLLITLRLLGGCHPLKTIKYNLLVCGIVGFTITFSQFDDHCDSMQDLCPKMIIELLIICQMRFFLVFTIFALNKQVEAIMDMNMNRDLFMTLCISIAILGSIFPILVEYLMMDVQKVFILLSIFAITASWVTKLIK